ncbi:unnamed protein product [Rhizophagus irregularis]|uniref:F-box domain-containing protein n=1 Tax=Rhizophagus irregularis TaxID=588596 RepID=A0A916E1V5_9GLOM|nr:IS66 family insertion sequence element accessory protein TnpB [Rhizophagus irregularis DAOM 181602=DAOM 197198]CAB5354661.1 unnamed protein product [Rhizophagus irregularis]
MQNQSVEQEAKPISTEQEANPNSTEQEVKTKSIEQEANTNLTDQEAKSNSNKQEANSKLAEQGTKSNSTEQETKSNSTEHEIKSNSTEQETKSNLAEQETKFNSIGQETKFNSIGQETINISNSTEQGAKANLTEGISLNNLTPSSSSSSSSSYLISSHILNLTQEVFIEICENLPPKDLYTLTLVYLKPPGDLSEQKFVWLLDIGETCQYCGKKIIIGSEERRLFWEFKVLVCSNCAQKQTISFEKLRESENYSEEVRSCLPCISETIFRNSFNFLVNATSPGYYGTNPYYWKADVSRAVNEYNSLSEVERENWVNEKQIELRNYLEVIEDMRAKENNSSLESFDEEAWDQCRGNVEKLVNKILQITGQPKWNHKELV